MPFEPLDIAAGERIVLGESFGQANRAQLETASRLHARGGAQRDLRAAAADVDRDGAVGAGADGVRRGEMNQPRFFRAGDHADAQAHVAAGLRNEVAAILGFADGARRGHENLFHAVRFGQPFEFRQRLHGGRDVRVRQPALRQSAGREPDHVLLAIDDLERQILADATDNHVDGVAADVDSCDAHML